MKINFSNAGRDLPSGVLPCLRLLYLHSLLLLILFLLSFSTFAQKNEYFLFVGTFTTGKSEGIYVYNFNTKTGKFEYKSVGKGIKDPSYLAISADKKFVYSAGENTPKEATIHTLIFDEKTANLTLLNTQITNGERSCHVSIDKTGKWVFVANFRTGNFSVFPVENDGKLGKATQTIQHEGKGAIPERQEKAHAHSTYMQPDNKHLWVVDLGLDKILYYDFDEKTGKVSPSNPAFTKIEDGAGPRHLDFHPNGKFVYSINEINSTVCAFEKQNGILKQIQTVSSLPANYNGRKWSADIHISPDGKFLYASNRAADNIAIYSIDTKTSLLTNIGFESSGGKTPRNFMITPEGNFLLAANQDSDNIVIFKRNKSTGMLTKTDEISVPNPVCLKMVSVK